MKKGYKFRIYPNQEQQVLLAKTFGCCRFVWNYCLAKSIKEYETWKECPNLFKPDVSGYGLVKLLPDLKREFDWLKDVSSVALQQQLLDLGSSFSNFFNHRKNYPKFKKKQSEQSFRLLGDKFKVNGLVFCISKSKDPVKIAWSRSLPSKPTSVTISQDSSGRYFASFVCEYEPEITSGQGVVGIDLGIKDLAIFSTGEKIANPRHYLQLEHRLSKAQRQLSKKQKCSNNRNKARIKVAKLHVRIKDQRSDFLHKLTTRLVRENQAVAIESLRPINMGKNRKLSKHIFDAGWGMFKQQLIYKTRDSQWCNLVLMDPFFPSSHICSECGVTLDRKLTLGERKWSCICGALHDRDINAAQVICAAGAIRHFESKCHGTVLLA